MTLVTKLEALYHLFPKYCTTTNSDITHILPPWKYRSKSRFKKEIIYTGVIPTQEEWNRARNITPLTRGWGKKKRQMFNKLTQLLFPYFGIKPSFLCKKLQQKVTWIQYFLPRQTYLQNYPPIYSNFLHIQLLHTAYCVYEKSSPQLSTLWRFVAIRIRCACNTVICCVAWIPFYVILTSEVTFASQYYVPNKFWC